MNFIQTFGVVKDPPWQKNFIMDSVYTPLFYNGYIDDICAIFTGRYSTQHFLNFINGFYRNIKFTIEHAAVTFPFFKYRNEIQ